jgi:hypothetical protein
LTNWHIRNQALGIVFALNMFMKYFTKTCWMIIILGTLAVVAMSYTAVQQKAILRVNKVKLRANPMNYTGPCPHEIKFNAKVSATGMGEVICRILRSDNLPAPELTLNFTHSGTIDTTYSYNSTDNFMGWHQLEIIKPNKLKSNKAEFTVMCMQ